MKFQVPKQRLRARWKGRTSGYGRQSPDQQLTEEQEVAICQYLNRLDAIGTSA